MAMSKMNKKADVLVIERIEQLEGELDRLIEKREELKQSIPENKERLAEIRHAINLVRSNIRQQKFKLLGYQNLAVVNKSIKTFPSKRYRPYEDEEKRASASATLEKIVEELSALRKQRQIFKEQNRMQKMKATKEGAILQKDPTWEEITKKMATLTSQAYFFRKRSGVY